MLDGATLVLVEVRYRSSEQFGGAAASVTWRKQRRLANAAEYLLLAHPELRRYPARFDVVAISAGAGAQDRSGSRARSRFTSMLEDHRRSQLPLLRRNDHAAARPVGRGADVHRGLQRLLPADDRLVRAEDGELADVSVEAAG